jgi:hypothetical protein
MKRSLLVAAALAVAPPALAAQALALSVEGLARGSELVVRGRVLDATARWYDGRILTIAEVEVSSALRGAPPARLTVITPGGEVGGIGQRVDGAAALVPGEEVVLFLGRAEAGHYRVTGLAQGKFAVARGMARPDLSHLRLLATPLRTGEQLAGEMPVEELERRVRSVP